MWNVDMENPILRLLDAMKKKINVALLFGGRSFEHEVSLLSAHSVLMAIDRDAYRVVPIGIDKKGEWHLYGEMPFVHAFDPRAIALGEPLRQIENIAKEEIDVVFPILHGPNGEDGTVQGLLALSGIPYVGADVLGSAVAMDKDVTKRLLQHAQIPVAPWKLIERHERHLASLEKTGLTLPLFIKPATGGSSIGVSKITKAEEWEKALNLAFSYSHKVLVEEAVTGREVQCGILGNEHPIVSLPLEIIPKGEFHSYESKYIDADGAQFIIPTEVSPEDLSTLQTLSLAAYKALGCRGMARVDLFLAPDGSAVVNELNTIPGLTHQSPFKKIWIASGVPFSELIDRVIRHAMKRHDQDQALETNYVSEECLSIPSSE